MPDLNVSNKFVEDLIPYPGNARTHSKKQIDQIARSIQEFGFTNPVLIDAGNNIIAGHGRVLAAKQLGHRQVPTICLSNLTEDQIRAYIIADNRLAELAGWDQEILAIEFQLLLDSDIDVTITGFENAEIDLTIHSGDPRNDADDELPVGADNLPPIAKSGDLWILGDHRVLCGDALLPGSYQRLMGEEKAHVVFTDPPYNVPINGHVCGSGSIKHAEFAMACGEITSDEFTDFLGKALSQMAAHSTDGSIHFVCMDWRHITELTQAGMSVYSDLKNLCVWNKDNAGMGSLYRSKHELVFVFKNGTAPHINNVELGKHGRYRTNVWDYPGVNTFTNKGYEQLALHPTVKPIQLVADALLDCSNRGDVVLDPFGGSGTTLLAAERTGRHARVMELDPRYVDLAIHRWQTLTGQEARHADTGQTYSRTAMEVDDAA